MPIGVRSLKTCLAQSQVSWMFVRLVCFIFCFSFIGFLDAPTPLTVHFSRPLSVESFERFHHRKPPRMSRQCICGGDDHLAWKRLVSSEACRGLRTVRGYDSFFQGSFKVHPLLFRVALTLQVEPQIIRSGFHFIHMGASMGLQSRVSSDRFSYLHSSLLYICSELDVSLITSRLPFGIFDRHSLWSSPYTVSYLVFPLLQEYRYIRSGFDFLDQSQRQIDQSIRPVIPDIKLEGYGFIVGYR